MFITFLTQYYPPEIGAPQARLSELALRFAREGHSVTILTAMPNYPTGTIHAGYGGVVRREKLNGIEVIRTFIYPTQKADFVRRLTNYFSFVLSSAVFGAFLLRRTDYLLVESPPLFLGVSGVWLSWLKRARLIFNVSDLWPETAASLGILQRDSTAYRLSAWLEGVFYQRAWLITGQSKSILSDITRRFPSRAVYHLSNGVDTAKFGADLAPAPLTRQGECVVLYAGLHGLAQGLDQVLDAALNTAATPEIRYVLIGDGPEKQALMSNARNRQLNNVEFRDPVSAASMPAIVAAADIVLITLKGYIPGAVPSKLYEAMASARPVVLVASGEAADIVRTHNAGIVVEPGDIVGLTRALLTLCGDPALRSELGANGRRVAEESFSRAKIATAFIQHLESSLRPDHSTAPGGSEVR